jgi:hypothetical protein
VTKAVVVRRRSPVSAFSECTSTWISIDEPNAALIRPDSSSTSPTCTLHRKTTESTETVTASPRACRMATTAAHLSISASTRPPKIEPRGFESSGRTISVICTMESTTAREGESGRFNDVPFGCATPSEHACLVRRSDRPL